MRLPRYMVLYKPPVSVVLPVYNAARWLPRALASISAQTFQDFDFIAVDDGSTDDSLAILRRHAGDDPRLRVISRPNTGIVGALNDGLAAARGWLIARMDADDEAMPDRFARQVASLAADPELVAVGSAVTFMDAAGNSVQSCPRPLQHADIEHQLLAGDGGALIHPAVMFRAAAVRAAGGYRGFAQYHEDLDLFLRLARLGRLANRPESLLRYRVHAASINFTRQAGRRAVKLAVMRAAFAERGLPFDSARFPDDSGGHGDPAVHAREWAVTALGFRVRRVAVGHGVRAVWRRPLDPAAWRALRYAVTAPFPAPPPFPPMPHLLYIGQTPAEGTGSPVIVFRHLQRLALAGWSITVIAEAGQSTSFCTHAYWSVQQLPLRRRWWPPFRTWLPFSRALRTWLLAGECQRLTAARPPDAVLGYLAAHDDFYAEIATRCARRLGAPLSFLIHDDAGAFQHKAAHRRILHRRHATFLRQAHRNWFVSPELSRIYDLPDSARQVLLPIPSDRPAFAAWRPDFALWTRVYYAGYIWPSQLKLLRRIADTLAQAGASLVLLTRGTPELQTLLQSGLITHVEPFPTNGEAMTHLAREAAGLLVAYTDTVAEMPWIATSFPSKFVEYAQLGLPCAIVAPSESAVGLWAGRDGYADFFPPDHLAPLAAWARDLRDETTWQQRSDPVRRLAAGAFSPVRIHQAFVAGLLRP